MMNMSRRLPGLLHSNKELGYSYIFMEGTRCLLEAMVWFVFGSMYFYVQLPSFLGGNGIEKGAATVWQRLCIDALTHAL